MAVSSVTEHWIKQGALTINLNHFGDPDYLQVSLLAGTVVMAYKSGVIDYNAAHDFRTWPLEAANTYLETTSAYNVYARLTRTEVNAKALIVYDPVLRDIEGREITYDAEGKEVLGEASEDYFFVYLGEISASVDENGVTIDRYWSVDFRPGTLNTDQYRMEEDAGAWAKMFRLNKVTDMIDVLKTISSAIFKRFSIQKGETVKEITDIKRSTDPDEDVPVDDLSIPTTAYIEKRTETRFLKKYEPDETQHRIKFFDGIECGEYNEGALAALGGSGTLFDGDGYGEMNGLRLREFLEVPELRFNRIDVVSGMLWNSIAFGLIESVDTERLLCTLKLEEGERCSLQVNDICIGIFSDFGRGTVADEEEDENGFPKMYGFRTSYFTPTQIVTNEAGQFQFRYALQNDDTPHPCPSMKFAVYGNFTDETRRASAYSTRTYKRYLNNVGSWKVIPDQHIYAQYGKLDGLTIGGFTMSGYGSFQSNSYLKGAQIQFDPDILGDLKGEDAYSVTLSSYEGLVKIDAEGNITSSMTYVYNVVTGEENVVTGEDNVVTTGFSLRTVIQAAKGKTPLVYSDSPSEGKYVADISVVGCDAYIQNGSIIVTEISDPSNCYVNITVNCEGNYPVDLTYRITAVYDGDSSEIETIYSVLEEPTAPEKAHPYVDDEVWTHTVSDDNIWMAVATRKNNDWTDWVVSRVKGLDVVTYEVEPPSLNLRKTLTGTITPKASVFTCYRCQREERKEVSVTWSVQARNGDNAWATVSSEVTGPSFTFEPNQQSTYDEYMILALPEGYTTPLKVQVVQTEDTTGPMPRYCGTWKEDTAYYYNEKYRDIVIYGGNVYQVWKYDPDTPVYGKDQAPTGNTDGSNNGYWEVASKFSFVAMDTALIDGAHIAGFTFNDNKMLGGTDLDNPTLVLDGVNGSINAQEGYIGGFSLENSTLSSSIDDYYIDQPTVLGHQAVILSPSGIALDSISATSTVRTTSIHIAERDDYGLHIGTINRGGIYVSTSLSGLNYSYALYADGDVNITGGLNVGNSTQIEGDLVVTGKISASDQEIESGGNVVICESLPSPVKEGVLYVIV